METLYYTRTSSPVGPLFLAASKKGLVRLEFDSRVMPLNTKSTTLVEAQSEFLVHLRELDEYFSGRRKVFSFPLDLRGTVFQIQCWRALLDIPYGEVRTYRDNAVAIGHPKAFRAVGMANNRNPIAIVVPCHRVIASDGSLCGYGGGLEIKRRLLDLEHASYKSSPDLFTCIPQAIGA